MVKVVSEAERLFETSGQAEKDGIWLEFSPTLQVKIRRANKSNKKYRKCLAKHTKPIRRLLQENQVSDERGDAILLEIYAESVIIDWKGFTDESGKEMKPTFANIVREMTKLPDLFEQIKEDASGAHLFREHIEMEADVKN